MIDIIIGKRDEIRKIMTHTYLDKMDGFYRHSLKENICHFLDFSIIEEMFRVYMSNLRLVHDDIIEDLLEEFIEDMNERMIFNQENGRYLKKRIPIKIFKWADPITLT